MAASKFKVALVQLFVTATKADNLSRAAKLIGEAARNGAKLVALPECFNSPYGTSFFPEYAETIPGQSTDVLSKAAKENGVYLVGGSIPEKDGDKLYNTCTVYNPAGDLIAKHRKVHLFDIDIPGKIRFQESEVLTAGNSLTMVETPFCKLGIGICYDVRFAEMAQIYAKNGCNFLLYPGAFNMTTGPAHWEMLAKARAIDNQCYVGMIAPARDEKASYVAWGHSLLVDPWGTVMETADADEKIVYSDIDLAYISQVRQHVPISFQKRTDLYSVKET